MFREVPKYETLKSDKEKLLQEIIFSFFCEDDFKMNIIKQFIDLDDPALIGGTYCFINNYGNLRDLYKKALIQIKEGKFENYIF